MLSETISWFPSTDALCYFLFRLAVSGVEGRGRTSVNTLLYVGVTWSSTLHRDSLEQPRSEQIAGGCRFWTEIQSNKMGVEIETITPGDGNRKPLIYIMINLYLYVDIFCDYLSLFDLVF